MNILLGFAFAALLLGAAAYAQAQVPRFTAKHSNVVLTRSVLIAVGIAFGYVAARPYMGDSVRAVLAFLVHGVLDSFLAFTPTATLLWVLLGTLGPSSTTSRL